MRKDDFTPTGVCIQGAYENDRNAENSQLYKDIVREVFGVSDVIIAHHIVYVTEETRADGFHYQIVEEIPSADALIFNHDIARKLWGPVEFPAILAQLACTPVEDRDNLLREFYYDPKRKERANGHNSPEG